MSDLLDLAPACAETTRVAVAVRDDQLHLPTPCEGLPVAALLDHLMGLALAFTPGALPPDGTSSAPAPSADDLDPAWRELLPLRLAALAEAWHDPEPYGRPLQAGGVTMDGAEAVAVALDEVVLLPRKRGDPQGGTSPWPPGGATPSTRSAPRSSWASRRRARRPRRRR